MSQYGWCFYVLSNAWATLQVHEQVKQNWGWVEESVAYQKQSV